MLADKNEQYGQLEYWDNRYKSEKFFEWFNKPFHSLPLTPYLLPSHQILHLGCGNSKLGIDMYHSGYKYITNVDYSSIVIDNMKKEYSLEGMNWDCVDIFELVKHYPKNTFDVAIDKGTLDALVTEKHDPWNPHESLRHKISDYLHQVYDILNSNGIFLHITWSQPHFRRIFLEASPFKVIVKTIPSPDDAFEYYLYICEK